MANTKIEKDQTDVSRRQFLRGASLGAGAAGAVAVMTAAGASPAEARPADDDGKTLYRATEHVRHYYAAARRF